MLTIATNLLLWLLAVTNDTIHMEIESQLREVEQRFAGKTPSHIPVCVRLTEMTSREVTVFGLGNSDITTSSPECFRFPITGACLKEMGCKERTSSLGGG